MNSLGLWPLASLRHDNVLFLGQFPGDFYGLLRIGEVATKSTNSRSSVVQYNSLNLLVT